MTRITSPQQATRLNQIASAFCRQLRPPEKIKPSEWAEKYREIKHGKSREPGRWRNARSPHLVGIMDAAVEPGVQGVVVMKGARIGYSESWKNVLGYWIDCDPDPTLFVLPDKESADKIVQGEIRPLLHETKRLSRYLSDDRSDNKMTLTRLHTMDVSTGWAGSAQSLAATNQRRVLFDETDKFPMFSGRESSPISLGMARANTYADIGRAFYMLGSTPTTRMGHISQRADMCTQHRRWHAPCPKCGEKQQIKWSQIKWSPARDGEDRIQHAARIAEDREVWYECDACGHHITEDNKPRMMRAGEWVADDPNASNRWVAFHAPSYISLMIGWWQIAESWIRAQGNPPLLMEVVNQYLGEPFEEQASSVKLDVITKKKTHAGQPMVLPDWSRVLLATADVQKDHLWFTVRAWGHGYRSQLIRYGIAPDFETLGKFVFEPVYATHNGEAVGCSHLMIDARYRTDEVYRFAQRDPAKVWPVMGDGNVRSIPIRMVQVKEYGIQRRTINPNYWQDVLHGFISSDDQTQWLPHAEVGEDYAKQLCSMHKIHDPKAGTWLWTTVSQGADNHLRDCEVYQCVLAQEVGVAALPSPEQEKKAAATQRQQTASRQSSGGGWLNSHRRYG